MGRDVGGMGIEVRARGHGKYRRRVDEVLTQQLHPSLPVAAVVSWRRPPRCGPCPGSFHPEDPLRRFVGTNLPLDGVGDAGLDLLAGPPSSLAATTSHSAGDRSTGLGVTGTSGLLLGVLAGLPLQAHVRVVGVEGVGDAASVADDGGARSPVSGGTRAAWVGNVARLRDLAGRTGVPAM